MKVNYLIIHCSAVKPTQTSSARQIDAWHKARGWRSIGYHYVIRRDGTIERGRPDSVIGAHCAGHNADSIGICYEGGLNLLGKPADTRTEAQKHALRSLINSLKIKYPHALVRGHNDFSPKPCPCFDVKKEFP